MAQLNALRNAASPFSAGTPLDFNGKGLAKQGAGAVEPVSSPELLFLAVPASVEGPGVVHKILYGSDRVSSVRDRAQYLYEQLQLPEEERLLSIPELDELQRMHRP